MYFVDKVKKKYIKSFDGEKISFCYQIYNQGACTLMTK